MWISQLFLGDKVKSCILTLFQCGLYCVKMRIRRFTVFLRGGKGVLNRRSAVELSPREKLNRHSAAELLIREKLYRYPAAVLSPKGKLYRHPAVEFLLREKLRAFIAFRFPSYGSSRKHWMLVCGKETTINL